MNSSDAGVMPSAKVPFVKGDKNATAHFGLVQNGDRAENGRFRTLRSHHARHIRRRIVVMSQAVPVPVNGNVVQHVPGFFQQRQSPALVGQRGGKEFNVRVGVEHELARFPDEVAPFADGFGAHFVTSPVLVADAPVFDVERLFKPVRLTKPAEFPNVEVAVFDPVAHLFWRSRPGVCADVRFRPDFSAPLNILCSSERVRFLYVPSLVPSWLTVWTDSLFPMVGGNKAPARPSDDRDFDFPQSLNDVFTKPDFIGKGRAGIENAAVHLTMKMLDEMPENHGVVRLGSGIFNGGNDVG